MALTIWWNMFSSWCLSRFNVLLLSQSLRLSGWHSCICMYRYSFRRETLLFVSGTDFWQSSLELAHLTSRVRGRSADFGAVSGSVSAFGKHCASLALPSKTTLNEDSVPNLFSPLQSTTLLLQSELPWPSSWKLISNELLPAPVCLCGDNSRASWHDTIADFDDDDVRSLTSDALPQPDKESGNVEGKYCCNLSSIGTLTAAVYGGVFTDDMPSVGLIPAVGVARDKSIEILSRSSCQPGGGHSNQDW